MESKQKYSNLIIISVPSESSGVSGDFGNIQKGDSSTANTQKIFKFKKDAGSAEAGDITLVPLTSPDFSIVSNGCTTTLKTASAECAVKIKFKRASALFF